MLIHQHEITLSPEDFDSRGNILPAAVLSALQDLASSHAELLGVGFDNMLRQNLLWVVTQVKYQVCAPSSPGTVIGITWPLPPVHVGYEREYVLRSASGEVLLKAMSMWMLIDCDTRRLAAVDNVYPQGEHCTERCFEKRARRLRDFDAQDEGYIVHPQESDIDWNGHVNNTKYAGFVTDALGDIGGVIDTFQIDYISEVMRTDELHLHSAHSGGSTLVKGVDSAGKRMFACAIEYKSE